MFANEFDREFLKGINISLISFVAPLSNRCVWKYWETLEYFYPLVKFPVFYVFYVLLENEKFNRFQIFENLRPNCY